MSIGGDDFKDEHGTEFHAGVRCMFCGAPHRITRVLDTEDECARCASPLFPAERHRLDYSGQRMLARTPKQGLIEMFTTWPLPPPLRAEMRDLSLNGMSVVAAARLIENQIIKLDGDECAAIARVAHCSRAGATGERWRLGLEFLTLRFKQHTGTFVSLRV